ncbi:hypothetical protein [Aquitalea pelogenes]|uniref:hypothetical protein n=1 Tax=Aquitalea pelogenes TaxID=1293573 RepID=UPI0007896873|nr:hypothetical protein [Aquitalea pelogenes]
MAATKQKRRGAHLEMVGGKGGRQRVWEAIRANRDGFYLADISRAAKVDLATVRTYVQALERGGFIQQCNVTVKLAEAKQFAMVKDNGLEAPRLTAEGKPVIQGLVNEAMWRTMRMVRDFNFHELAALASTTEVSVAPGTARTYLKHLATAGYLIEIDKGHGKGAGGIPTRYRFNPARNSGPRPPMIQRTKSVYDPNLGQVVWQEEPDYDC